MKNLFSLIIIAVAVSYQPLFSQNAPISTVENRVSAGTKDTVAITAINFNNIASCNLRLIYDHNIVKIDSVLKGSSLPGSINTNTSKTDTILFGWYTYPGKTLPDNTVIFRLAFSKVTSGTSPINFSDDGYSCVWYNGVFQKLNDLPASTYYINGSITFGMPPNADFTVNNTTPPKNTTVQFTDLSTGGPTNWSWSFDRPSFSYVNGTNANSQHPQVQFTDGGLYTVTLVASNASGSSTKVKTDYIRAGTPGLWTGTSSSDWSANVNWDNWLVPSASTNVVIPSSAPNWPVLAGNLSLGSTCMSVSMYGSSELTINGDIFIGDGSSFLVNDSSAVYLSGNWLNAGTFLCGTGTIDFTGTSDASIVGGGSPVIINNYYNLSVSKSGGQLIILPDIIVNGDLFIAQ